ncbi:MAG: SCO family protein [Rhizobiales bacterium]|nr:SCO family protein [Hyphomicrobiales bacterium]
MPSRRSLIFALGVLSVALIMGGAALFFGGNGRLGPIATGKALVGGPFELTNQDGKRVRSSDFAGKYLLVVFGYTYCPDICPGELQVVSAALDELGRAAERIQPIFVTVDPARDTPEVLKDYVGNFHPDFVGLTGSEEDIAAIARAYKVYYRKVEQTDPSIPYLMDHTTLIYLMGPDGSYVTHFAYGTNVAGLAEGLRKAVAS